MADRSELLARAWNETVEGYEEYFVPRFAPWVELAVGAITNLPPEGPILVPCCGTFPELERLTHDHPDREMVGIDLSPGMVERARQRADQLSKVKVHVGDAADLDDQWIGVCAAVVSVFGLQQIPDPEEAFLAWAQALRPGGLLSVVYWPDFSHFEQRDDPFELAYHVISGGAPRDDSSWQERLVGIAEREGLVIERDEYPAFTITHRDAASFWDAMAASGPYRATALARGEEFMVEKREEFLDLSPEGALTHSPPARWILARR